LTSVLIAAAWAAAMASASTINPPLVASSFAVKDATYMTVVEHTTANTANVQFKLECTGQKPIALPRLQIQGAANQWLRYDFDRQTPQRGPNMAKHPCKMVATLAPEPGATVRLAFCV